MQDSAAKADASRCANFDRSGAGALQGGRRTVYPGQRCLGRCLPLLARHWWPSLGVGPTFALAIRRCRRNAVFLPPISPKMLLNDTKEFLKSENDWYADRNIPFRRGYLLHGVPRSGKFSLTHAIASKLMLDIYTHSLSSLWNSDGTLTTLMFRVPALHRPPGGPRHRLQRGANLSDVNTLSVSGLLNALDSQPPRDKFSTR
ncbi:hypothetical protein FIBSPDRAFT_962889 [Athelia psychrophila]|uniref:ATPase AAA-type core domain-containing protein n=1 Tax=Athelia psychrophila TaxID=1759441 RepID=A0A165ZKV0_9AGAM|nr:hypothetical protein FIBSPDRAFT_962889 [Fibularhizoctonia sp. CBS 109695]